MSSSIARSTIGTRRSIRAIVFAVHDCGFVARWALELSDATKNRYQKHPHAITARPLELKLEVEDFGQNQELDGSIRAYHRLLRDYMMRRSHIMALHTRAGYNGA